MFKTFLKHSLRSFRRQKGYFLINITGLALGLACSLLIAVYVLHELSYDRFNQNKDSLYRLILNGKIGEQDLLVSYSAAIIGPTMKNEFPEVEEVCRLNNWGETNLRYETDNFEERALMEADSTFFDLFSIPLIHGNAKSVLNKPFQAVLSESTARKIFGEDNPVDKVIYVGNEQNPYTVSGIMSDVPENCHFDANVILSFVSNPRSSDMSWFNNSFETYLLLNSNSRASDVENKMESLVKEHIGTQLREIMGISVEDFLAAGNKYAFFLQPLLKIHFQPEIDHSVKPAIDPKYLIIFGSVALLIIIIAAINFMNLSTAQSAKRAREVGMKKVSGSSKSLLVTQFLTETITLSLLSLVVAVVIVKLSLPFFNNLLNSNFGLELFGNWYTILLLIFSALLVGLLAGSYPAFYLSSISPSTIFHNDDSKTTGNGKLRSVLVIIQFAASIMLIIGTVIMYRQISYMLNKDHGYDKEQLMIISRAGALDTRVEAFKERVKEIPGVINIAAATAVPNRNNNNNSYMIEGKIDESMLMTTAYVDYDHLDTYKMEMVDGRFFSRDYPADREGCILNESAISEYDITDPFNTNIMVADGNNNFTPTPIIGIVKNFHFESLHHRIKPYIMRFRAPEYQWGYLSARIAPGNITQSVGQIESIWKEFTNNSAMPYFFMDDDFNRIYRAEKQSTSLTVIFAIFAMVVASLGLWGLTSFMLQHRTREIGVRKAMGSSVPAIFYIITRDTLKLITIASLIAIPVIYLIGKNWLENFFYRISLSPVEFLAGYLVAVLIALSTISYRTVKAARANPAESLRHQ